MKKILIFLLTLILTLSLLACNNDDNDQAEGNPETNNVSQGDPGLTDDMEESDPGDTNVVEQSDEGQTNDIQWYGEWMGDGFSIVITEYDGLSFWFEIMNLRDGSVIYSGTANLYPDDYYMAEYGEVSFSLYDDYSAIDFFASESSQWANFRGHYERLN